MSDTPRTGKLLETILDRDGSVGPSNAPEEWVVHARQLERELVTLRTRVKELEKAGNALVAPAWENNAWKSSDLNKLINAWEKAKGTK